MTTNNWAPLPGVTRLDFRGGPLAKSGRWTWRDTLLIVPGALAIFLVLPILYCCEKRT